MFNLEDFISKSVKMRSESMFIMDIEKNTDALSRK